MALRRRGRDLRDINPLCSRNFPIASATVAVPIAAEQSTLPTPVSQAERLATLDLVRGCAVLGILLMNVWSFAGPQAYFDNPAGIADRPGAPLETWAVVHTLFEGSQRALFSLLFGAGMLLMVTRLEATPGAKVARLYYRRTFLLITIGLFDAFVLLWPADILLTYGLCGLLLYPLRRLPVPVLLTLALVVMGLNASLRWADLADARELSAAYPQALTQAESDPAAADLVEQWEDIVERTRPDVNSEELAETIRITSSGDFGEFYRDRATTSLILQTVVALNAWFLDALAVMLIGMAAMRIGVFRDTANKLPLLLMLIGYGTGLPLSATETWTLLASGFDPLMNKFWLVLYDLRRLLVASGHLGLLLAWSRRAEPGWLRKRVMAVGRMALSNYLGQSVLGALVFYTVGFGLFGRYTGWQIYIYVFAVWLFQLSFSHFWLSRYRFGPAEWLWRSLTYRQQQTLRLGAS